jgi:hypothetical protein
MNLALALVRRRFACEACHDGTPAKAAFLRDACGAPAHFRCIGLLHSRPFFTCGQHRPREGHTVIPLDRAS